MVQVRPADSLNENVLGTGFGNPELTAPVFPPKDGSNINRSLLDYEREEENTVQINPRQVQENFFKDAMENNGANLNKFFRDKNKIPEMFITEGVAAYNKIKNAQQNNIVLPDLEAQNQKVNLLKSKFLNRVRTSPELKTGIFETGSFPINAATDKPVLPADLDNVEEQGFFGKLLVPNQRTVLTDKLNEEKNFMQWAVTQPDAPYDKKILKAIARSFSPSMSANLARRVYETFGFINEGLGFYLPELLYGGWQKAKGASNVLFNTEFGRSRSTWFPPETQKELLLYRSDSNFFKDMLPDTDRHRIVNEIIREDFRKKMKPEDFERLGYNKKITTDDGVEVYERNFVTPAFANKVFEWAMDDMNFFEQLGVFVGESVGVTKGVLAPFQAVSKIAKGGRASKEFVQRNLHTSAYGKGVNVPFRIDTIDKKVARSVAYANTHNISVKEAATELSLKNTSKNWYHTWSSNRIANRVATKYANKMDDVNIQKIKKDIDTKEDELREFIAKGDKISADATRDQIQKLQMQKNYKVYQALTPNLAYYGLNPEFDFTIGIIQATGRQIGSGTLFGFGQMTGGNGGATGEGMAVLGALTYGGIKRIYSIKGPSIPFLSNAANNVAFNTKIGIEEIGNVFLKIFSGGTVGARGLLINPDLRTLNSLKGKMGLSTTQVRTLDTFTTNMKQNLSPDQQEALLKDLTTSLNDIHLMTKDLPVAYRSKVANDLVLSLAEASGVTVFQGMALSIDSRNLAFKNSDILKVKKKLQSAFDTSTFMEKRINTLSTINDRLKATILEMENAGDVDKEVIGRLKNMANMYESSANNSKLIFQQTLTNRVLEIDKFFDDLKDPSNADLLRYYTEGTKGRTVLGQMFELRREAEDAIKRNADFGKKDAKGAAVDPFEIGKGLTEDQRKLVDGRFNATETAAQLIQSIVASNKRLSLTNTSVNAINQSNKSIRSIVNIINSEAEDKVTTAYKLISPDETIDFSNTGNRIYSFLNTFSSINDLSVPQLLNPNTSPLIATSSGQRFLSILDKAAQRGMDDLFNDPDVVDMLNRTLPADASKFEVGNPQEIIDYFQNEVKTNRAVATDYGVTGNNNLSPFQLIHYMINKNDLNFIAEDFNFMASPKDVEDLRISLQKFKKSSNEKVSTLGTVLVNLIDQDYRAWANNLNEIEYNNVTKARYTHRLERQRFDDGTIGGQILKLMNKQPIEILGEEVGEKEIYKVFSPLIKAIVNPTDQSAAIVQKEMSRIITTFSPSTGTLPDNILVKEGGKFREPNDDEIKNMINPVVDLRTEEGQVFALSIVELMQGLLKSQFISTKGLDNVANQIKRGEVPDTDAMMVGNVKVADQAGLNLPKQIKLPSGGQFESVQEYLDAMEQLMMVKVIDQDGYEYTVPLLNMQEILVDEDHISNAIVSSKKFKDAHEEYWSLVKQERESVDVPKANIEEITLDSYKQSKLYKDQMNGDAFLKNVIFSGNPNSVDIYIDDLNRLVDKKFMTVEEKKSILQALFVDVIRAAGGEKTSNKTFKFYNGVEVPVKSYATPEVAFNLLTEYSQKVGDAREPISISSEKLRTIMNEAGVTREQEDLLIAIYRHGTKMDLQGLLQRDATRLAKAREGGIRPEFTLNNTLSKAFNIARGMVSKEYVAAEMAIRYAALAEGALLNTILNDGRVTQILTNLLTDERKVTPKDADYFVRSLIKFSAIGIQQYFKDSKTSWDEKTYWESKNVIYPKTQKEENPLQFTRSN